MNDNRQKVTPVKETKITRRYFLRIAGTIAIGVGAGGYAGVKEALPKIVKLADGRSGIPVSGGYLLVDVKKCQGCESKVFESVGLGMDHRFEGKDIVGSALVHTDEVIHMAFFSASESDKTGPMADYHKRREFRM